MTNLSNRQSGWSKVYLAVLISPRTLADETIQDNLPWAPSHSRKATREEQPERELMVPGQCCATILTPTILM